MTKMLLLWLTLCMLSFLPSFTYRLPHVSSSFNLYHDKLRLYESLDSKVATIADKSTSSGRNLLDQYIPEEINEIQDAYVRNMLAFMQVANVPVPSSVSRGGVSTTYSFHPQQEPMALKKPPVVLIHGFDSSCLEFRRLAPKLSKNHDVYAPDILGWGFNDISNVLDFSPSAKLEHLKSFIQNVVKQRCILIGASLGGGIAINLAAEVCPELVEDVVLIDAQVRSLLCCPSDDD